MTRTPGAPLSGAQAGVSSYPLGTLHRFVRGIGALSELQPVLEAVASAAVLDLGFVVATLSLVQLSGDLRTVAVAGSDDARDALLGNNGARADWDALVASAQPVGPFGGLCFIPAGTQPANDLPS